MRSLYIPKLSFCITCKNRLHQIRQTLRKNLEDNRLFKELIEFVVIDFGSTDGFTEWISKSFMEDIDSGYLRYYYTTEMPCFHMAVAKNTSHIMARNDILVNLDCDNFTGYNGGRFIIKQFMKHGDLIIFHQASTDPFDGSFGRVGISRKAFYEVGGYDESFEPINYEDLDLINRLREKKYHYKRCMDARYNQAIRNEKEEGVTYTNSPLTWDMMDKINHLKSDENIRNGKLIANENGFQITTNIFDIHGKKVI